MATMGLIIFQTAEDFISRMFTAENPVIYSFLFLALFIVILFLIKRHVIGPMKIKHRKEKQAIEQGHVETLALIANLNPNPMLRISPEGKILLSNIKAQEILSTLIKRSGNIFEFIDSPGIDLVKLISANDTVKLEAQMNGRVYSVIFKGISKLGVVHAYFHDITSIVEAKNVLKDYQQHVIKKAEEDRQHIARELHDGVNQNISHLKHRVNKSGGYPEGELEEINSGFDQVIEEIRNICNMLVPKRLAEEGLDAALASLVVKHNSASDVKGTINVMGPHERPPANIEVNMYRVSQEAINNIVKHSEATEFSINLRYNVDELLLMVSDNGKGFYPSSLADEQKGFGMISMSERVESVGGKFSIDSEVGQGTTLTAKVPLSNGNGEHS